MTKYYKETLRAREDKEIEIMYWKVQDDTTAKIYNSLSEFGWEVYKTNTVDFDWDEVSEISQEEFNLVNKEVLQRINSYQI